MRVWRGLAWVIIADFRVTPRLRLWAKRKHCALRNRYRAVALLLHTFLRIYFSKCCSHSCDGIRQLRGFRDHKGLRFSTYRHSMERIWILNIFSLPSATQTARTHGRCLLTAPWGLKTFVSEQTTDH